MEKIYVHKRFADLTKNKNLSRYLNFESDCNSIPKGSIAIPPSPKALYLYKSKGLQVPHELEELDEYNLVEVTKVLSRIAKEFNYQEESVVQEIKAPANEPEDLSSQADLVVWLEKYLENNCYYKVGGQLIHLKDGKSRPASLDYISRQTLGKITLKGRECVIPDKICRLAIEGSNIKEISISRPYPMYSTSVDEGLLITNSQSYHIKDCTSKETILNELNDIFTKFLPFNLDGLSLSSTIAALLSPLVNCNNIPIWVITSSTPGVGKTMLAQCAYALATGEIVPVTPYPESDAEARKQITSSLISSQPCLIWDNLVRPLGGASIDSLCTSRVWRDRILGQSKMIELTKHLCVAATGNNICLTADTFRRVFATKIEPKPDAHKVYYNRDLVSLCQKSHKDFVNQAIGWLRFFEQQNYQPKVGFGSFEQWNNIIGGFVEWLLDYHISESTKYIEDETSDLITRFCRNFPFDSPKTTEEILASSLNSYLSSEFLATLKEITPKLANKELNSWLTRHSHRVVGNVMIDYIKTGATKSWLIKKYDR